MNNALVGYTGFVGSNLLAQMSFQHLYNSKNYKDIKNREFDLLVFSGAKAEKWKANENPIEDQRHIEELIENLNTVKAKTAVLISTVDVYPNPNQVDERTEIPLDNHAYGKNRLHLENFFHKHFENSLVIRLPGLFGSGLKKNVIFDLLNKNQTEKIDSRGSFQFYNLDHISSDINKSLKHKIKTLNVSSEPVTVGEIASHCFDFNFENLVLPTPAKYDFKSIYSELWARNDGYLYSKDSVLKECKRFVEKYREVK